MNLLPARGAGERTIALDGGGSIALGDGLQAPPGAFVVGFRPEDISPQTVRGAAFALATDWVESVGADTFVYGHLAGASTASLVMRCPGSFAPPLGATTTASVAADRVHFFDPATGARIAVR
jgi:ABC-type sugar transport system ATPase subunit